MTTTKPREERLSLSSENLEIITIPDECFGTGQTLIPDECFDTEQTIIPESFFHPGTETTAHTISQPPGRQQLAK